MLKEIAAVGSTGQKITVLVGAEERSPPFVQIIELRRKTECGSGSAILDSSLLGTRCLARYA